MITLDDLALKFDPKIKFNSKKNNKKESNNKLDEENLEDDTEIASYNNRKPIKLEEYNTPILNIPTKKDGKLSKPTIDQLGKILLFIDRVKYIRYKNCCTIMPIPVNNKQYLEIWNSEMGVSRAIDFMKKIGLIELESEEKQFGAYYECDNHGYTYRYYYDNEVKIIEFCKKYDIEKYDPSSKVIKPIPDNLLNDITFKIEDVRFSYKLSLEKPLSFSKKVFEQYLYNCLCINYPGLNLMRQICKDINNKYYQDDPQFSIRFNPHYKWKDNKVIKIGIRATNSWCNLKKEDRRIKLEELGFNLERDVKSSIPRVHVSLLNGAWVNDDIDFYKMIYNKMYPNTELNNEVRNKIKSMFFNIYFDEDKDAKNEDNMNKNIWNKIHIEDKKNFDKNEAYKVFSDFRKATFDILGLDSFDNEIFYVESYVYLLTLYDLLSSGHKTWLVYDCFYSKGNETNDEFRDIVDSGIAINFKFFLQDHFGVNNE